MSHFDARPYLKEIARGRHGARDLSREQARELFAAIFAGEVDELALGAVLVAYRIKGETAGELAGMRDALAAHLQPVSWPTRRALPVVIPTYNGARKLPNLVPLLALLLAREGVPVLLHGVAQESNRVSTFEILSRLGQPVATSLADAERRLEQASIAALPIDIFSPALAAMLAARFVMGLRNSAHTLAKMILPSNVAPDAALRLLPVTHPDFQALMRDHFASFPGHVMLMRGVEGEAVVRLHAPQPIEQIDLEGRVVTHLLPEAVAPELPAREAAATAQWTRDILEGRREVPEAIARQVALVAAACRHAPLERPVLRLVT